MKYKLRPYQQNAVDRVRDLIKKGFKCPLIVSPTGSGKTVIGCSIIERAMFRQTTTIFLAHRKELIDQCSKKLSETGIPHGIIRAKIPGNRSSLIQVASKDTLLKRLVKYKNLLSKVGLLIIDEAHHAVAQTYLKIIKACNPNVIVIGLTATPYRLDGKGLGDLFDSMDEVATINELIEWGFLVRPRTFIGSKVNVSGIKRRGTEYNTVELSEASRKPKLIGNIVESWMKHASDRLTIGFCVDINHSKTICAAFVAADVRAEHVDGKMTDDVRDAIFKRFENGITRVLLNCDIATEGYDCPEISCVLFLKVTQSRCSWRQWGGRGLRPHKESGKQDCLIMDHSNCTANHGFLTDPDKLSLKSGVENKRVRPDRKCPSCAARFAGRPYYCPSCGIELVKDATGERMDAPLGDDDEMVEVTSQRHSRYANGQNKPSDKALRFLFIRDMQTAKEKKYSPLWASMRYKNRAGSFPSKKMRDEIAEENPELKTRFRPGSSGKWKLDWA